MEPTFFTYKEG